MTIKYLLCSTILTCSLTMTAYGAVSTPQTITAASSNQSSDVIELTGTKVITDYYSFKVPENWKGTCLMILDGDNLEVYDKAAYEQEEGSGLLFTIAAYEDASHQALQNVPILGFCNNTAYVLEENTADEPDSASDMAGKNYDKAIKSIKKSFVTFVKDS